MPSSLEAEKNTASSMFYLSYSPSRLGVLSKHTPEERTSSGVVGIDAQQFRTIFAKPSANLWFTLLGRHPRQAQHLGQIMPGVTRFDFGDFFRRSYRHNLPAAVATFWANVDDVVSGLDDI